MKVDKVIVAVIVAAMLSVQGWTLIEVVNLKIQVAELAVKIEKTTLAER